MISIFVGNLDEESVAKNRLAFQAIDEDNSGQLDQEEMQLAIQDLRQIVPDLNFTSQDVQETFRKLDVEQTGLITYSQFVFATLDPEILANEDLQRCLFNDLDSLQEGFLTK